MELFRIILAEDEPITRMDIKEMLLEEELLVVGECGDGLTAVNLAKAIKPDLVVMDIKMPCLNGIEAARQLNEERVAPVLLLTAYSSGKMIDLAREAGVLAYLVKPVTKPNLIAAVRIAVSRYKEFDVLRDEISNLNEALRTRKLIERAKGLLQKKYLLSEEQAFQKIRMISKKQQKSMGEVAEAIIVSLGN